MSNDDRPNWESPILKIGRVCEPQSGHPETSTSPTTPDEPEEIP
jgi:hypothetical protein